MNNQSMKLTPIQERRTKRNYAITHDWSKGIAAGQNRTVLRLWLMDKYHISSSQFYNVIRTHHEHKAN